MPQTLFEKPVPIARYRFSATVQQPLQLPDYAGSLLRGQFGAALRQVACMTRQPTCAGCPLLQTCPYSRIFDAPAPPRGEHALRDFSQVPNPYVMEPPEPGARTIAAGASLHFGMVLIGHATEQLALVVFALQRALAQGLTRQRIPAVLTQVQWLDAQGVAHTIWTNDRPALADHPATLSIPAAPVGAEHITLQIHAPLRLQQQGGPLGVDQLTPRALIAALARRTALLLELQARQSGWGEAARLATHLGGTLDDTRALHWFDWTRYSSRQHQEMTLGGVLGHWTLHGHAQTVAALWPWLWLGQWLHVGKNATMGMGGYTLVA